MTVTLQPGMTSVNVTVSTTSDGVIECTECFDAELGSPSHGVVLGSTTTLNTCILDADGRKLCVCVRACVRARACVCVCVCVCEYVC